MRFETKLMNDIDKREHSRPGEISPTDQVPESPVYPDCWPTYLPSLSVSISPSLPGLALSDYFCPRGVPPCCKHLNTGSPHLSTETCAGPQHQEGRITACRLGL